MIWQKQEQFNSLNETGLHELTLLLANGDDDDDEFKMNYLPSAVFIAQLLVGPSKQLKQTIQAEHNIVKNPNWPEANQLAIYKLGRGFELGVTEKQIQVVFRVAL